MEWFVQSENDDLIVPKDQELSDRLPSPESWLQWGLNTPQNNCLPNKYYVKKSNSISEEMSFNRESLSDGVDMEFSVNGGQDYQLDCLAGFDPTDDIFLYKRNLWD